LYAEVTFGTLDQPPPPVGRQFFPGYGDHLHGLSFSVVILAHSRYPFPLSVEDVRVRLESWRGALNQCPVPVVPLIHFAFQSV
jgi:hypothetical protein